MSGPNAAAVGRAGSLISRRVGATERDVATNTAEPTGRAARSRPPAVDHWRLMVRLPCLSPIRCATSASVPDAGGIEERGGCGVGANRRLAHGDPAGPGVGRTRLTTRRADERRSVRVVTVASSPAVTTVSNQAAQRKVRAALGPRHAPDDVGTASLALNSPRRDVEATGDRPQGRGERGDCARRRQRGARRFRRH